MPKHPCYLRDLGFFIPAALLRKKIVIRLRGSEFGAFYSQLPVVLRWLTSDSLCLAEHARLVLTDSGGLQEETTFFRTPCLTLRPNTERPITVTIGSNQLTRLETLREDLQRVLSKASRVGAIPAFWDGKTAERIIACLGSDQGPGTEEVISDR